MNISREVIIKNQNHNHEPEPRAEIETLEEISFDTVMAIINDWEKW